METKNAQIGAGAKAPHLSYLGDAVVGEGANIGAGVIFANYDGVNKSTTTVGAFSFVGSNSVLTAPWRSPPARTWPPVDHHLRCRQRELAVSRGRQRNVPGWVARKRAGTKTARAAEAALDQRRLGETALEDQQTESAPLQDQQVTSEGSHQ